MMATCEWYSISWTRCKPGKIELLVEQVTDLSNPIRIPDFIRYAPHWPQPPNGYRLGAVFILYDDRIWTSVLTGNTQWHAVPILTIHYSSGVADYAEVSEEAVAELVRREIAGLMGA